MFKSPSNTNEAMEMQYRSVRFTAAVQLLIARVTADMQEALKMADELIVSNQFEDLPTVIEELLQAASQDAPTSEDGELGKADG